MLITRFGRRYPKPVFVEWRDNCFAQLDAQNIPKAGITKPCDISIKYTAGDNRRRDAPGIIDALWHVFEKYGIVKDDTLLGGLGKTLTFANKGVNKENPHVEVLIQC